MLLTAKCASSIPGQGTKIHKPRGMAKKKKKQTKIGLRPSHLVHKTQPLVFLSTFFAFLLSYNCSCGCVCAQSCLTLCDPMDCSPPGSSVHGFSQARILEWVAIPLSRGSSDPGMELTSPALAGGFFTTAPPGNP